MQIQLSFNELRVLRRMLQTTLGDLRVEIRHSRGSEFKTTLKRREAIIRGLLVKLDAEERRVAVGEVGDLPHEALDW